MQQENQVSLTYNVKLLNTKCNFLMGGVRKSVDKKEIIRFGQELLFIQGFCIVAVRDLNK